MSGNSWVTLATNDSYSLGALVLAQSLRRVGTIHNLTVLVTPGVTSSMRTQLASVFNIVEEVNILDSKDEKNLALLTRPDLGITFTKLHCWRLTQFSKCVFLDADVLVLQNCDELFDREELSAAPDVGWPDCFNSGVFVYRPSIETYNALINFALSQGSFDGGDQGLLNLFFSDWATKDISRHLPFIYNMCSSATYSYLPAFKQFGQNVKIVHFIGSTKPWLQYLDSETRQVRTSPGSEHLSGLLQLWWDIFCHDVHSNLSSEMAGLAGALSQLTLGVARSPEQVALEEHLRKQAWEHGNIDYMGRDSFDNIWRKICQTLAEAPSADPLPQQSKPSSQVSSVVAQTVSQGDTSAGDTSLPSPPPLPPPLPEPHSLASSHKESSSVDTDAGHVITKSDSSEERASTDANFVIEPSSVSSDLPMSQTESTSAPLPDTNVSPQITTPPPPPSPLISPESVDIALDSQEKVLSSSDFGTEKKSEDQGTGLAAQVLLKGVALSGKEDASSSELVQPSSERALWSVSQDGSVSAASEVLKLSEESTESLSKISSYTGEETSLSPEVSSPMDLTSSDVPKAVEKSEVQSVDSVAKDAIPLPDSPAATDILPSDSKSSDPVSLVSSSDVQSNLAHPLDPVPDPQKVTVIEPTPPTSPIDSSTTAPPSLSETLAVDPTIPATPPVGSEPHVANVSQSTTTGPSPASVAPPDSEGSAEPSSEPSVESSESVESKAPVPPKRRHKPSQNPDQSGSKTGKPATKAPKGKK